MKTTALCDLQRDGLTKATHSLSESGSALPHLVEVVGAKVSDSKHPREYPGPHGNRDLRKSDQVLTRKGPSV